MALKKKELLKKVMAFFKVASTRADPEVRLAGHP